MKTLVGSRALLRYFDDFYRQVDDIDYFSDTEIEGADVFYHPDLEKWSWGSIATLDELYTIKVSHSFWQLRNNSWNKHMRDIQFMQEKGAFFIQELHEILYPIWEESHGEKKANLEQEPDKFFNPKVDRKYDHDSIHASIAYYDRPLFNEILRDGHPVAVDRKKFEALPLERKLQLVREEVYATALERHLIPGDYVNSRVSAYKQALKQTVTSFSKGWFPLFIVLNWNQLNTPDLDFVKLHKSNADRLVQLNEAESDNDSQDAEASMS